MSLKATTTNVVIRPEEPEQTTSTGLYIPPTAQKTNTTGIVLSVGPDAKGLSEGDKVLYPEFAGASVQHEGEELFVVPVRDIMAVISE